MTTDTSQPQGPASDAAQGNQPSARDRPLWLIHHSANRGSLDPPGSLAALQTCLRAGARLVELDILPLRGGGFALLHGPELERDTTGSGEAAELTAADITKLHHVRHGEATDVRVGLLRQALEMIADYPHLVELQLDLKAYTPLTEVVLGKLAEMLQPHKSRVRVTSPADWGVRRLRAIDADLPLGFDPLLYLEIAEVGGRTPDIPPFRKGAYGYWDDHPLASRRWGPTADYLAARAEGLWVQAPAGAIWYISARLLRQTLEDGFDWIGFLHQRGADVDAWTLDAERPGHATLAQKLAAHGVDRITTNNAPALAGTLDVPLVF